MSPPGLLATPQTGGSTVADKDRPLTDDDLCTYLDDTRPMTKAQARRVTEDIKLQLTGLWHLVKDAYIGRAWVVLGYENWDAYCSAEFPTSRMRLPREERAEVVASLRDSGLSIRAIESATGISRKTVIKDLNNQVLESTPPDEAGGALDVDADQLAKELIVTEPAIAPVIGLDGKRYQPKPSAPQPKPPRKSFADVLNYRFLALSDDIDRIEQLIRGDRFRRNRTQLEGAEKIPAILHRFSVRLDDVAELAAAGGDDHADED
jgi:lambda repressor-like predicted transcriptional regulator